MPSDGYTSLRSRAMIRAVRASLRVEESMARAIQAGATVEESFAMIAKKKPKR